MSDFLTFIILFYLVITNPFVRIISSETHVYISFRAYRTTVEENGDMLDHKMAKNFKLFRYSYGD